jgi:hypothetical protein
MILRQQTVLVLPALLILASLLCACSSQLHLIQTSSGRGYISRLEPERRIETGVVIFEDLDRMLVMVPEEDVVEIRPIDALEAKRLGGTTFFISPKTNSPTSE